MNATQTAIDFFYEHAGYSRAANETEAEGRARSAREYAEAERIARESDWRFVWMDDEEGCIGCTCGSDDCACSTGEPHETLGCVLYDDTETVLASLWGICGADSNYRRVIEAELAAEATA